MQPNHWGKYGELLVELFTKKATLDDFRECPRSVIDARGLNILQARSLILRDGGAIDTEFNKENPRALQDEPTHVRGAKLVELINDPNA